MESIHNYLGMELNWKLVKNMGYVLHAIDKPEAIAILIVQGVFGSKAEGKCDQGYWIFKRAGILKNNISVADGNTGKEIAAFKKKGLGGSLKEDDGKTFSIERNALMTEYSLSIGNQQLISYQHKDNRPQVFLQSSAREIDDLPLLVVFLGYLVIMQRIDANFVLPY